MKNDTIEAEIGRFATRVAGGMVLGYILYNIAQLWI